MSRDADDAALQLYASNSVVEDDGEACIPGETHVERLGKLFNRYYSALVRSLARTHTREEAKDIASAAFEAMLAHEHTTSLTHSPQYLYRTARNLSTDRHRMRSMQRRKSSILKHDLVLEQSSSPEAYCVQAERAAVLRRAIEHLPAELRMALILRVKDELSDEDIVLRFAQEGIRISTRTVRRYISEAHHRIADEVDAAESPFGNRRP
jgi:RNA polymerase sigma factor (sigma-70 family)